MSFFDDIFNSVEKKSEAEIASTNETYFASISGAEKCDDSSDAARSDKHAIDNIASYLASLKHSHNQEEKRFRDKVVSVISPAYDSQGDVVHRLGGSVSQSLVSRATSRDPDGQEPLQSPV
jgi:hypothetical protein